MIPNEMHIPISSNPNAAVSFNSPTSEYDGGLCCIKDTKNIAISNHAIDHIVATRVHRDSFMYLPPYYLDLMLVSVYLKRASVRIEYQQVA